MNLTKLLNQFFRAGGALAQLDSPTSSQKKINQDDLLHPLRITQYSYSNANEPHYSELRYISDEYSKYREDPDLEDREIDDPRNEDYTEIYEMLHGNGLRNSNAWRLLDSDPSIIFDIEEIEKFNKAITTTVCPPIKIIENKTWIRCSGLIKSICLQIQETLIGVDKCTINRLLA